MARLSSKLENVVDAAILAIVGTIWYKVSGGRGNFMPNIGGTNPPQAVEAIAPTQADEGNFDTLLTVLKKGGSKGIVCSDYLNGMHSAFIVIHHDYSNQFRNFFFSSSAPKPEDVMKKIDELLGKLCTAGNDDAAWAILSQFPSFPVQRALELCREIEAEIKKYSTMSHKEASKKAYLIVAKQMIADKRLQGSVIAHAEENFAKAGDSLNNFLQGRIQKRNDKKVAEATQEKKTGFIDWWKIIIPIVIVLWFSIEIFTASTAPVQKNNTINPIGTLENKISNGVGKAYQSITKEKGE